MHNICACPGGTKPVNPFMCYKCEGKEGDCELCQKCPEDNTDCNNDSPDVNFSHNE